MKELYKEHSVDEDEIVVYEIELYNADGDCVRYVVDDLDVVMDDVFLWFQEPNRSLHINQIKMPAKEFDALVDFMGENINAEQEPDNECS